MKKILLTIISGAFLAGTAGAQCSFDSQYAGSSGNFFPDSATFLMDNSATAGQAYDAVISMRTISDTLVTAGGFTVTAYIDAFKIHAVNGAPAGFSFTGGGVTFEQPDPTSFGDPADSTWWNNYGTPGNASTITPVEGCMQITAAASAVDAIAPQTGFTDYPVQVLVDARVAATDPDVSGFLLPNGTWLSETTLADPLPVDDYVLRVHSSSVGIAEMLNPNVFEVHQSYPNPAGNEATITFTTPRVENIEVKVFNMLGAIVHSEDILSETGVNDIKLNTGRMSAGLYVYTVSNGTKTFTQKMTVK